MKHRISPFIGTIWMIGLLFMMPQPGAAQSLQQMFNIEKIRTSLDKDLPNGDANWGGGSGFNGQILLKSSALPENYLMSLFVTGNNWDTDNSPLHLASGRTGSLDGDLSNSSIGASLVTNRTLPANLIATFELGFAYQFLDSNTYLIYEDAQGTTRREAVNFDNGSLFLFGIDIGKPIGDDMVFSLGAGYQISLSGVGGETTNYTLDNDMDAFKLRMFMTFNL